MLIAVALNGHFLFTTCISCISMFSRKLLTRSTLYKTVISFIKKKFEFIFHVEYKKAKISFYISQKSAKSSFSELRIRLDKKTAVRKFLNIALEKHKTIFSLLIEHWVKNTVCALLNLIRLPFGRWGVFLL